MALTNYVATGSTDVVSTPIEYVNMCISNTRTCTELTRNLCVTTIFATPYASSTATGGVCIYGNPSSQSNMFEMNMVIPKGNCLGGSCVSTFHGCFFGD